MISASNQQNIKTGMLVPQHYATLVSENEVDYTINLFCKIPRFDIQKFSFQTLKISVFVDDIKSNLIENVNPAYKGVTEISKAINKSNSKVTEIVTDISKDRYETRVLTEYYTKSIGIPEKFSRQPSMQTDLSLQQCNIEIINKLKVDPADAVVNPLYFNVYPFVNKLRNHYLVKSISTQYGQYYNVPTVVSMKQAKYLSTFVRSERLINSIINIPKRHRDSSLKVIFQLQRLNEDGSITISEPFEKSLSISTLLSYKNLKIKKPSIVGDINQINLIQNEEKAKGIKLQKKVINNSGAISNYVTIAQTNNVKKDFLVSIPQPNSVSQIQIYRCLSYYSDVSSHTAYTNLVFGTTFSDSSQVIDSTVLLFSENKFEGSINIFIKNVPVDATEFSVVKKKYILETAGEAQEEEITVSRYQSTKPTPNVVIDKNLRMGDVYEYFVRYKMNDGTIKKSISKIYQYVETLYSKPISAQIINTVVQQYQNKPEVILSIDLSLNDEENKLIKKALENNAFYDEYKETFKKQLDKIDDLLFFKVIRTNLTESPGVEEEFLDMLTTQTATFTDNTLSQQTSGVSELNPYNSYKYEIKGYLKNPLSFIKEYIVKGQTKINVGNKTVTKSYRYKPYKWNQKKVIQTGTMLAEDERGNIAIPTLSEYECIGVVAETTISKLQKNSEIKSCTALRVDKQHILINWTIDGTASLENYDHFVIVKEASQKRDILTTVYGTSYLDTINEEEAGQIYYYVIPVYANYDVASAASTNAIVVDPGEF